MRLRKPSQSYRHLLGVLTSPVKTLLKVTALFALALTESAFGRSEMYLSLDRVTGNQIPNMFFIENRLPIFVHFRG